VVSNCVRVIDKIGRETTKFKRVITCPVICACSSLDNTGVKDAEVLLF
jgi:hypothetical protein